MAEKNNRQIKTVELKPVFDSKSELVTGAKDAELGSNIKTIDGFITSEYKSETNKFLSVVKGIFVNNWQLKITAVVAGMIIWGLTIFL